MPNFLITAPDGTKYNVTGPDGSTESEALAHLQEQLASKPSEEPTTSAAGLAKSAGTGLANFGISAAGGLGDLYSAAGSAAEKLGLPANIGHNILGAVIPGANLLGAVAPTSQDVKGAVEGVTGPPYQPKTFPERAVANVAEFAPAALAGPGGLARRVITQAVIPGVASEAAGSIPGIKGTAAEPVVRAGAAMLSPIAAERAITPITTPVSRAAAVDALRNEGVQVTAGQSTGSKFLRKQEGELGGTTAENFALNQAQQFTSAALRRAGENAPLATPEVVDHAFTRIGNNMDRLATNNALQADRQMINELRTARNEYERLVAPNQRAPIVQDTIDDLITQFRRGATTVSPGSPPVFSVGGDVYQTLRSRLGADARRVANDPQLQRTLYAMQNAIDDGMERSIARQNPNMLGDWQQARQQYRNLLTIEKAVNYAGEAAAGGVVTPGNLARAVKAMSGGKRDYSRGRGDLAPLARAGAEVMSPLANSNTASRLMTNLFLHGVGGALGGAIGLTHGPVGATLGATAASAAFPRMVGEGLMRGRGYLGNRILQNRQTPVSTGLRGAIGAISGLR